MGMIVGEKWGVVTALALGLAISSPASAEPLMWTVRDQDTTVHLFGTVHLLAPDADWKTPELQAAMDSADALWMEIDILHDTSSTMAVFAKGTSPDRPLRDRLTAEQYARVEAAAERARLPMATIEQLRPWLAAVTLSVQAVRNAGYDATGVDVRLAKDALARKLPVRAFETGAEQIAIFSSMPEDVETALLLETADMAESELGLFDRMFQAWLAGDRTTMQELLVQSMLLADPALARALLTDRNRAWAERFEEIMAEPGERVVAVGAGHLVGEGSLPDLLRERGWTVDVSDGAGR